MYVRTLPVYSKLADETVVKSLGLWEKLPHYENGSTWHLSRHQVETFQVLTCEEYDVVFNIALTGDGKSLAGQLPLLVHGWRKPLLAMYPTNELIQDQQGQLAKTAASWKVPISPNLLDGQRLDEITAGEEYEQRGEALLGVLRNAWVVLTNPDIFHLIMHQFYVRPSDASDRIFGPLAQKFAQFTFDEFHIFDAPQVVSVLNALLLLRETTSENRLPVFLFQSATPSNQMLTYLERSGLRVCAPIAGEYLHTDGSPDAAQWRRILHGSDIHFSTEKSVEAWLETHLEDMLLPFFIENRPHAKGAIIVNSVAAAQRILARLQPAFAQQGLNVEPNTGLTSRARRKISYEADLLIGTSTIDVGVDFQINFLLFESRDAGSFLQRLGRLGRHAGYNRDGQFYAFEKYAAHAIIPTWVKESLFDGREGSPALLKDGETTDRESLNSAVCNSYPATATFDAYAQHWGKFQSLRILRGLANPTTRGQYAETLPKLQQRYQEAFQLNLKAALSKYRELWQNQRKLLEEAFSFRGGSYFDCGLIDASEDGAARFKIADCFQLAANTYLDTVSEEDFYQQAERAGCQTIIFRRREPLAFFRLLGWREEREDFQIVLSHRVRVWSGERFGQAHVFKGFRLDAAIPGLTGLNNHLSRREIPALLCLGNHPLELKRRLRLPLLFPLYVFSSLDNASGSVAFGREALLLDTRLAHTKLDCGGNSAVVV